MRKLNKPFFVVVAVLMAAMPVFAQAQEAATAGDGGAGLPGAQGCDHAAGERDGVDGRDRGGGSGGADQHGANEHDSRG